MDFLTGELVARFLGVLAIDLILSGDNAVVIALAVRNLEGKTRKRAIFWGTFGAVAMRLAFAAVVTFLIQIPFLQVVGALLLLSACGGGSEGGSGESSDQSAEEAAAFAEESPENIVAEAEKAAGDDARSAASPP